MAAEAPSFPRRRSVALDWLVGEARGERFAENLFAGFCNRLVEDGVPLERTTMYLRTLHPQFIGARFLWRPGLEGADLVLLEHGEEDAPRYRNSPVRSLFEGAEGFRRRLDLGQALTNDYPVLEELRLEGYTDFSAMPLVFVDGKRHATSWATRRPGGFTTDDLTLVADLLPVLGMAVEIRMRNRMVKNLLNTYVGPHAAEQILNGAITRGSGVTVRAAIFTCDLRGFTTISEQWPRDDVISLLNDYFDTMATPVERHGGEVLKFIGDALLAIFPLENEDACGGAIRAALEARRGMRQLNAARLERGQPKLGFGLALHVGDVMYGNIGSKARLDFTVIGPAVNVTSRLESLTKELRREVLISGSFVGLCPCGGLGLELMGSYPLRGVEEPIDVYALPQPA